MAPVQSTIHDPFNAFCPDTQASLPGAAEGPLRGLSFAAKDIFDVVGHTTGVGNPDWKATHEPATATASVVQRLVDAGATLVGKTMTDELTRGVFGENMHYGMPVNPRSPDRVPGGSSCGSAAAVAGGLVDFALGSDTAGSVRIPASFCGLWGLRPTHGRIAMDGTFPQAPSFDTIGWFTRDASTFARVGAVLLGMSGEPTSPRRIVVAEDAFEMIDVPVRDALAPVVDTVLSLAEESINERLAPRGLSEWLSQIPIIQNHEAWRSISNWIKRVNPRMSFWVADRYVRARAITDEQAAAAGPIRNRIRMRMEDLFDDGTIVCLPTSPVPAPPRALQIDRQSVLERMMLLTQVSGATGTPQLNLPLAEVGGLPVGLSLLGPRGSDEMLIAFGASVAAAMATGQSEFAKPSSQ